MICDRGNKLKDVREGILNLMGRNFYPNSTIQFALPRILKEIPDEWFEENNKKIYVRLSLVSLIKLNILLLEKC